MGERSSGVRRLSLIPFGLVLGLAVLEVFLQVGAWLVLATGSEVPASWATGTRRVLCLGDSNTYGLYLENRSQAYPQQFAALWNQRGGSPRIEVLNVGYPGTNSSRLRHDFRRMLETFAPDVAIVMVGSNNYWTVPVPLDEEVPGVTARVASFLKHTSRVYQLVYMVRRALDRAQLEVVYPVQQEGGQSGIVRYGHQKFAVGYEKAERWLPYEKALEENLHAVAAEAREMGVQLILMTYPSRMWNYGDASVHIRKVAHEADVRLIDLAAVFEPVCPKEPCPNVLVSDHHPNANGYRLIAETLVDRLAGEL